MEPARPGYRWAVRLYDRLYRFWHALDVPAAEVRPILRVELRRTYRRRRLADGTTLRRGSRVCVIHLNNDHVEALHADCESPVRVGLAFRRQLVTSLRRLAVLAARDGCMDAEAFVATTIFHHGLKRLGFEAGDDRLWLPELVAVYQRALLASLHPSGRFRLRRATYQRAERLWLSRTRLIALYGVTVPAARAVRPRRVLDARARTTSAPGHRLLTGERHRG